METKPTNSKKCKSGYKQASFLQEIRLRLTFVIPRPSKFLLLLTAVLLIFLISACAVQTQAQPTQSLTQATTVPKPQPTSTTSLLPTATTEPANSFKTFVGDNAYVPSKNFSLRYPSQLWTFLPTKGSTGSGPYLLKQSDEECYLALREGPREYSYLGPTTIAGRAWRTSWARGHYYVYWTTVGNDAFLFGLNLPREAARQTACKEEIKQILATFTVIADDATLTYNPSTMMTTTLPPPITDERFPPNLPLCPNNYKTTPFPQEACQIIDASVMPICSEGEVRLCKLVSYEMTTTLSEMEYTLLPADVISATVPMTRFTTVFVYGTPIFTATSISSEITGTIYIPYWVSK